MQLILLLNAAVVLFLNALFLLYTAIIVPVQIFMWDYTDPCNKFPTIYLDLCVDTFFLVLPTTTTRLFRLFILFWA